MRDWYILRPDSLRALQDPGVRKNYPRYLAILEGKKLPYFQLAKRFEVDYDEDASLEDLMRLHRSYVKEFFETIHESEEKLSENDVKERNLLTLKEKIAWTVLESCEFCERRCKVNRKIGRYGFCRAGEHMEISSAFVHLGEEPEITPSFTIFTLGCNLECVHCQNWSIAQWFERGDIKSPQDVAKIIDDAWSYDVRNVNLVGGEPTVWTHYWISVLKYVRSPIPVFWNSNGIYSDITAELLKGLVDIVKIDFKYGNDMCAMKISRAPPNYVDIIRRNLKIAKEYSEILIRVLVLPGHLECCLRPILRYIKEDLGKDVRVNIMFQYRPEYKVMSSEFNELKRRLSNEEIKRVYEIVRESRLENVIF
ncbi:MAG: radical SAM protein [Thermoplasmata archaeon]|nr:radical SAM protein [Euryarchaeota archaeon]RLF66335.1 MAG: radical SAM protein [Thermoplasmata archaeon]